MERNGNWMQTWSGIKFWPADPRPEEICIEDIAHHLSLICRFTGATKTHYSVAQHSVLCSQIVPEEDRKWGLLHDSSESYLSDISRPLKASLPDYQIIERRLMESVAIRFGLPITIPDSVHHADDVLVCTEKRDLLPPGPDWGAWTHGIWLLEEPIEPWPAETAEALFLARYKELFHA